MGRRQEVKKGDAEIIHIYINYNYIYIYTYVCTYICSAATATVAAPAPSGSLISTVCPIWLWGQFVSGHRLGSAPSARHRQRMIDSRS